MAQYGNETAGDNIEFTGVNIDTYTIIFNQTGTDTAITKFASNSVTGRKFSVRVDKNSNIPSINSTTFANPITLVADKEHVERRNVPTINQVKITTSSTNTKIKVRWF